MRFQSRLSVFILSLLFAVAAAEPLLGANFEIFAPGDVKGQWGWGHLDNSPTGGTIEAAPAGSPLWIGSKALAVRTRDTTMFGVANHLYSPANIYPAGETGSTLKTQPVVDPESFFRGEMWVMMPPSPVVSGQSDGRFGQINPASRLVAAGEGADRYAFSGFYNANGIPEVRIEWPTAAGGPSATVTVAQLEWGKWYRLIYQIRFVDGLNGTAPNDIYSLTIYSTGGLLVGNGSGSTWEAEWRTGGWGGGATPRAVNGFDFWSEAGPDGTLAFHLGTSYSTGFSPPLEPLAVTIDDGGFPCTPMATLSAVATGGHGWVIGYEWRDGEGTVVGTEALYHAPIGTYTVTVTDQAGNRATSPPVTGTGPALPVIFGPASVRWDQTTLLTSGVTGGSGTVTSYEWRTYTGTVLGSGTTLETSFGIFTLTVTDAVCGEATSPWFQVEPEWTPDLAIFQDLWDVEPSLEGESVAINIFVMNRGGGPSSSATLTSAPANMTIVGVTGACSSFPCTLPGLGPGEVAVIRVTATLGDQGPFEHVATVSAPEFDPEPESNVASIGGMVLSLADLSIATSLTDAEAYFESLPARWTILVRNDGPRPARSVEVVDVWHNLEVLGVTGACTALPCTIPTLGSGAEAVVHIETRIVAPGDFGSSVSVRTMDHDPDLSNNEAQSAATAEPVTAIPLGGPALLLLLGIALAIVGATTLRAG